MEGGAGSSIQNGLKGQVFYQRERQDWVLSRLILKLPCNKLQHDAIESENEAGSLTKCWQAWKGKCYGKLTLRYGCGLPLHIILHSWSQKCLVDCAVMMQNGYCLDKILIPSSVSHHAKNPQDFHSGLDARNRKWHPQCDFALWP